MDDERELGVRLLIENGGPREAGVSAWPNISGKLGKKRCGVPEWAAPSRGA